MVTFKASGARFKIDYLHSAITDYKKSKLYLYTPLYSSHTVLPLHSEGIVEVVIALPEPLGIRNIQDMLYGRIVAIRECETMKEHTYIPFDHVVLTATGPIAQQLKAAAKIGDQAGIGTRRLFVVWTGFFFCVG